MSEWWRLVQILVVDLRATKRRRNQQASICRDLRVSRANFVLGRWWQSVVGMKRQDTRWASVQGNLEEWSHTLGKLSISMPKNTLLWTTLQSTLPLLPLSYSPTLCYTHLSNRHKTAMQVFSQSTFKNFVSYDTNIQGMQPKKKTRVLQGIEQLAALALFR